MELLRHRDFVNREPEKLPNSAFLQLADVELRSVQHNCGVLHRGADSELELLLGTDRENERVLLENLSDAHARHLELKEEREFAEAEVQVVDLHKVVLRLLPPEADLDPPSVAVHCYPEGNVQAHRLHDWQKRLLALQLRLDFDYQLLLLKIFKQQER